MAELIGVVATLVYLVYLVLAYAFLRQRLAEDEEGERAEEAMERIGE